MMKKMICFTILCAAFSASAQNFAGYQFSPIKNPDANQQVLAISTLNTVGMSSAFENSTGKQTKRGLHLNTNKLSSLNFSKSDKLEYGVQFEIESPYESVDLSRNELNRTNFHSQKFASSTVTTGAYLNYQINPRYSLTSSVGYSSGNERGAQLSIGAKASSVFNKKHRLTTSFSINWGSQSYGNGNLWNQIDSKYSQNLIGLNLPNNGLRSELRLGTSWNWNIDPNWSLSTGVTARHALGDSNRNIFLQQRTPVTIFSVITYRF